MRIRIETFRGYYYPCTCEEFRKCVDVLEEDLNKDFPHDQSLWWINVYLEDDDDKLLLCHRYWQNGMPKKL